MTVATDYSKFVKEYMKVHKNGGTNADVAVAMKWEKDGKPDSLKVSSTRVYVNNKTGRTLPTLKRANGGGGVDWDAVGNLIPEGEKVAS